MAALTEESARVDHPSGPDEGDLAERRVAVYLQSVGLGPESAMAAAAEIIRELQDQGNEGENDLAARAFDRTADRIDKWLDELAALCPQPTIDLRVQLRWHIRPVLQRHPEGFLRIRDLHDDFHQAVRAAARPILPLSGPAIMPPQSFGDLPYLWRRTAAWATLIRHRLTRLLWRMRT